VPKDPRCFPARSLDPDKTRRPVGRSGRCSS